MRSFFAAALLLVAIAYAVSCSHQMDTKWLVVISLTIISVWIQMEIWRTPIQVSDCPKEKDIEKRKRIGAYVTSLAFSLTCSAILMLIVIVTYWPNEFLTATSSAGCVSFLPGLVAAFGMYRTRDG